MVLHILYTCISLSKGEVCPVKAATKFGSILPPTDTQEKGKKNNSVISKMLLSIYIYVRLLCI